MKNNQLIKIFFCLIIVLFIIFIVLYKNNTDNKNLKLQIKQSSWSGDEDYQPMEITEEYDVVLGEKYNISESLKFAVKKINSDSIVIKTEKPLSDSEKGVSLFTDETEFTIYFDKELKLTTPSMDAGNIYIFKLVR